MYKLYPKPQDNDFDNMHNFMKNLIQTSNIFKIVRFELNTRKSIPHSTAPGIYKILNSYVLIPAQHIFFYF